MTSFIGSIVLGILVLLATPSHAVPTTFVAVLDGPSENPPNASTGTGFAQVIFDPDANTMTVSATFQDLVSPSTVAHIHCCIAPPGTVGIATTTPTFPGFPAGVTSGNYFNIFDTSLAIHL